MFMKCTARFYKMNYDFSPEFAEAHHEGKESENNRLHDWEDELAITTDVVDIEVLENSTYTIQGEKSGEAFSEVVSNMLVFNLIGAEGEITQDRKSTRLNSSHVRISYAVFCLKKKKKKKRR